MTDAEANAVLDALQEEAKPTTVPRIAEIIRKGRVENRDDAAVAQDIAEFIFRGEPKTWPILSDAPVSSNQLNRVAKMAAERGWKSQ